jgi:hypothetical protein
VVKLAAFGGEKGHDVVVVRGRSTALWLYARATIYMATRRYIWMGCPRWFGVVSYERRVTTSRTLRAEQRRRRGVRGANVVSTAYTQVSILREVHPTRYCAGY